jgi:hypothetical protein
MMVFGLCVKCGGNQLLISLANIVKNGLQMRQRKFADQNQNFEKKSPM